MTDNNLLTEFDACMADDEDGSGYLWDWAKTNKEAIRQAFMIKQGVDSCLGDVSICDSCGDEQDWWTDSDAHYISKYPDNPSKFDI